MAAKYNFQALPNGVYELYEDNVFLLSFTQKTFRKQFESLGRSSNWVGSMLRLFYKKYPLQWPSTNLDGLAKSDYVLESEYIENLKARGFRIFKPSPASDNEMIEFLEKRGFLIEGLKLNGTYYTSVKEHELV